MRYRGSDSEIVSATKVMFSRTTKETIRKRAWFACCICKKISLGLEIHHIVPQRNGGPNTEENAAPLCPSCHRSYGGNPDLQARIREMRDFWYDQCERLFAIEQDPVESFRSIHDTFSLEELERLTVHNPTYVLGREGTGRLEETRFSFHEEEYVHPRIVQELLGWISDSGSTIVGVNLDTTNKSNRFYGDASVARRGNIDWVSWGKERESFTYRHVATTPSGVEILECHDWSGGSSVFGTVGLFCIERDRASSLRKGRPSSSDRHVLKILGQFALGDRYQGDISYSNGVLSVGPNRGRFGKREEARWRIPVL